LQRGTGKRSEYYLDVSMRDCSYYYCSKRQGLGLYAFLWRGTRRYRFPKPGCNSTWLIISLSDLHANNILFRIPNFDSLTIDQVYDKLGEPIKVPNRRIDGGSLGIEIPSYSVISADMVVPADQVQSSQIMIGDFGEAFLVDSPPKTLNAPMLLLPPESFFHERLGLSADIWTLGCTIYEILGERPLFEAFIPNRDDTLAEMVSTLGILPERWWKQWKNRLSYFSDDGSWSPAYTGIMSPVMRPLNQRLWDMGRGETAEACQFTTEEMSCLEQLLSRMLVYEPSARISAAEVMNSVYMTNWACP
jgi:serine/threonine protein kinase